VMHGNNNIGNLNVYAGANTSGESTTIAMQAVKALKAQLAIIDQAPQDIDVEEERHIPELEEHSSLALTNENLKAVNASYQEVQNSSSSDKPIRKLTTAQRQLALLSDYNLQLKATNEMEELRNADTQHNRRTSKRREVDNVNKHGDSDAESDLLKHQMTKSTKGRLLRIAAKRK
jgi:hypothetical protein